MFEKVNLLKSPGSVLPSPSRMRSLAKPPPHTSGHNKASINARIVWVVCAVALSGAAAGLWQSQEPVHEPVVLSSSPGVKPQDMGAPAMTQFPGLAAPTFLSPVAGRVATAAAPAAASAPAAFAAAPLAQAAEIIRDRSESAAATASSSSIPVSTWPVVTRAPNEVMPRSDMRYQANALPAR